MEAKELVRRMAQAPAANPMERGDTTFLTINPGTCSDPEARTISVLIQEAQPDHSIPSAPLSDLAPICISYLPLNSRAKGRGLHGVAPEAPIHRPGSHHSPRFQWRLGGRYKCLRDASVHVLEKMMKSPRVFEQINTLASDAVLKELEVPEMKLFTPNWITPEEWSSYRGSINRELLQGIDMSKVFNPSAAGKESEVLYNGTWLLPSFINHCCVPNVTRTTIGESHNNRDRERERGIDWAETGTGSRRLGKFSHV